MQIEIFCLCKAITADAADRQSLLNIFDTKVAAGEPAMVEPFQLAVRLRFYEQEGRSIRFVVHCRDSNGKAVFPPITEIISVVLPPPHKVMVVFHAYTIPKTPLNFGEYEFSLEIDGKQIARTPLYVVRERT